MRRLFFMGDSHGKWKDFESLIITQNISDAIIWNLGDGIFGLGDRKTDMIIMTRLNDFLVSKNITLYNTRGNHDNPYWFKSESALLKHLRMVDKQVKPWQKEDYYYRHYYVNPVEYSQFIKNISNIKFVKDYDVVNINGLNIVSIGGAISIDRKYQTQNGQYYPIEKVAFNNKIYNLKDIDIVASHTIPQFAEPTKFAPLVYEYSKFDNNLVFELTEERKLMTKIYNEVSKKNPELSYWFYGHYHHFIENKYDEINFICLGILHLMELTGTK